VEDEVEDPLEEESLSAKTFELEPMKSLIQNDQALSCWSLEHPVADYMRSQILQTWEVKKIQTLNILACKSKLPAIMLSWQLLHVLGLLCQCDPILMLTD